VKVAIDQRTDGHNSEAKSLLTGVLYIGIDFFPGTPVKLVQTTGSKYPEIPTVPTVLERAEVTIGRNPSPNYARLISKGLTDAVSQSRGRDRSVGELTGAELRSAETRSDHAED